MLRNIGALELLIILAVLLLLFGARRLPTLARSIGGSVREFREGIRNATAEPKAGEESAADPKHEDGGSSLN